MTGYRVPAPTGQLVRAVGEAVPAWFAGGTRLLIFVGNREMRGCGRANRGAGSSYDIPQPHCCVAKRRSPLLANHSRRSI